ncbi:hypothetical protein EB796_005572 [Bugula neritina]|uniref:Uncharacterized protein n=1 Tax=Bugula neritina TaxID=10212 RepID=A0A7J7KF76_BUGNE|nr:hypothetical protein EB796_005572 [Bugula neritina]
MLGLVNLLEGITLSFDVKANAVVNVTIYDTSIQDVTKELKQQFADSLTSNAEEFCSLGQSNCAKQFRNENLSTSIDAVIENSPHVNFTISISIEGTNSKVPDAKVCEILEESTDDIEKAIEGREILSCNAKLIGIAPDDPTNWIMIAVFGTITVVLLVVVIALIKKSKANNNKNKTEVLT